MTHRKSNILSASRLLFNAKGYSHVTVRMIALELKISSGNLNYHFKKREDILEALYFDMVSAFDERVKALGTKALSLKTVKHDILTSLERMVDYRFFWTDLYNLLRLNKKVKSHFEEAYKNRFNGCLLLFDILEKTGVMKPSEFNNERQFLAERMINFSNTLLYNSSLYHEDINKTYLELQSNNLMSMLYPYFTDLGKDEFKNLVPDYFV
jgi:AcrR family transcriptional regulator